MIDWLVVGGGIHGVVLALALLKRGGVNRNALRIVDPHQDLLAAWFRRSHGCAMTHLRSPGAHGLEPDFASMRTWAAGNGWEWDACTVNPYARPSTNLFNAYCHSVVSDNGLEDLHVRDSVVSVGQSRPGGWNAFLGGGDTLASRRIVLATGPSPPRRPEWTRGMPGESIVHVYDQRFERGAAVKAARPVIVGGGLAAAQFAVALAAARDRAQPVTLVTRHSVSEHQFDSDPCYIGPRCLESFLRLSDPESRRREIARARHPGSVSPEVRKELEEQAGVGRIAVVEGEPERASERTAGLDLRVRLRNGHLTELTTDLVVLATGFADSLPGIVSAVQQDTGEPAPEVDSTGIPVLKPDLTWLPNLYVTGRPAELELGPSAPNIIGAHNAAKRIISSAAGDTRLVPRSWCRY